MLRSCVFCGEKPKENSPEHVIPEWLIKFTGETSRQATFGLKLTSTGELTPRVYAFDQFKFPACSDCNNRYSRFEDICSSILKTVVLDGEISGEELSLLLDWFDKVRVGLWLGMRMLNKNRSRVLPKFHIKDRLGQFDRALIVQKVADPCPDGINFYGPGTLLFDGMPSCFSLRVNNYFFTNLSAMFLVSRRLGFPFPKAHTLVPYDRGPNVRNDYYDAITFNGGLERTLKPVIRHSQRNDGRRFYQPIYARISADEALHPLVTEYVTEHSMLVEHGLGNIYEETKNQIIEYTDHDQLSLLPKSASPMETLGLSINEEVLRWQLYCHDVYRKGIDMTREQKRWFSARNEKAVRMNKEMLKRRVYIT